MRKNWRFRSYLWMIALLLSALSCQFINQSRSDQEIIDAAVNTLAVRQTQEALLASAVVLPPVTEAPTSTTEPTQTLEPSVTPSPTIAHQMFPGDPPNTSNAVTDLSSESYAAERRSIGDNFSKNLYERPFTSQVMDYQPYLDIVKSYVAYAEPWFYVTIVLEGEPPQESSALYAVELDEDYDGRGDWFIRGTLPLGTDWTTDGVQVFRDSNNDVGGGVPITSENPNPAWDGYDELVFDRGQGADPDAAWARRDPSNSSQIQLAFKSSLIGTGEFVWGTWSDEGVQQAGWLDYNDHFTLSEAGHPSTNSSEYPLKEMASLDNTCRWAFGFKPIKPIPGLCQIPVTPTVPVKPTKTVCQPPPTGCPVFGAVASVWNPRTCQCEIPPQQCQPPPGGCPVTAPFVWDPVQCKCVLR